jgi:hypothetical protein
LETKLLFDIKALVIFLLSSCSLNLFHFEDQLLKNATLITT